MPDSKSGTIVSVNISDRKGVRKTPVESIELKVGHGIEGDAHAGGGPVREVSLLALESIQKIRDKGLDVNPGDFAENVTTEGVVLYELPVGTRIRCGGTLLEVTQIGKECIERCAIYYQAGDCVMPREGIFVRTVTAGVIRPGDAFSVVEE